MPDLTKSLADLCRDALASSVCQCGNTKDKDRAFCYRCFKRLPDELKRGLYKTFSEGFVVIWDEAKDWLRINV